MLSANKDKVMTIDEILNFFNDSDIGWNFVDTTGTCNFIDNAGNNIMEMDFITDNNEFILIWDQHFPSVSYVEITEGKKFIFDDVEFSEDCINESKTNLLFKKGGKVVFNIG